MHCISADKRRGLGLALELRQRFPDPLHTPTPPSIGDVIIQRTASGITILHLVSKRRYFEKPSLTDLTRTIRRAAVLLRTPTFECSRIRVPRIGCGLDGLRWRDVRPVVIRELSRVSATPLELFETE